MKQKEGKCPKCGKKLEYTDKGRNHVVYVRYPVKCNYCHFEGFEIMVAKFTGFEDENFNDV